MIYFPLFCCSSYDIIDVLPPAEIYEMAATDGLFGMVRGTGEVGGQMNSPRY